MITPITDNLWAMRDGEGFVDHTARIKEGLILLETDRAALMEAIDTLTLVVGLTPIRGNLAALQEAHDAARAALSAARANFPTT